jgi:hypothetical protein
MPWKCSVVSRSGSPFVSQTVSVCPTWTSITGPGRRRGSAPERSQYARPRVVTPSRISTSLGSRRSSTSTVPGSESTSIAVGISGTSSSGGRPGVGTHADKRSAPDSDPESLPPRPLGGAPITE